MTKKTQQQIEQVEARLKEFWQAHANYDSQWVRNTLHNLNEFLPYIFEFKAVKRAVGTLYKDSGAKFGDLDWIDAPEHLPARELRSLPIFRLALELRAYAYYGLRLGLLDDIHDFDAFLEAVASKHVPINWGQDPETETTITAAFARQKIDFSS